MRGKLSVKVILASALSALLACYFLVAPSNTGRQLARVPRPPVASTQSVAAVHVLQEKLENLAASGVTQLASVHPEVQPHHCEHYKNEVIAPPTQRDDIHCNSEPDAASTLECRVKDAKSKAALWCNEMNQASDNITSPHQTSLSFKRVYVAIPALPFGHRENGDTLILAVEPRNDIVSHVIAQGGHWEMSLLTKLMYNLDKVNRTVFPETAGLLDVGANVGWYTFIAAAYGYPVVAFEAMKRNQQAMWTTMCLNPWMADYVTLFPYAPSDVEQECRMWSDVGNTADGHLLCGDKRSIGIAQCLEPHDPVHTIRLDDYIPDSPAHLAMKIDVEGSEPGVLRGANRDGKSVIGDRVKFAVSEVSPRDLLEKGTPMQDYLQMWQDMDFQLDESVALTPLSLTTVDSYVAAHQQSGDLFFKKVWDRGDQA